MQCHARLHVVACKRLACCGMQWHATLWHAMSCYGMACNGMRWHVVACSGMRWHAMAYDGMLWHVVGSNTLLVVLLLMARLWPWSAKLDSLRKQHYYEADRLLELEPISSRALPQRATSIPLHMCFFRLVDTYIHTYIHKDDLPLCTYIYTHIQTYVHSYIHVYTHILTYMNTYIDGAPSEVTAV